MFIRTQEYQLLSEKSHSQSLKYAIFCNAIFFCISLVMLVISKVELQCDCNDPNAAWRILNTNCTSDFSIFYFSLLFTETHLAPISKGLNLPVRKQLNADLDGNDHDIYVQPPSAEVDHAWDRLIVPNNYGWVSSEDLLAVGKDPSTVVKFPSEYGYGDDAYPVLIDVIHKLHCLNRLRKAAHFEYYFGDVFPDGNVTELHHLHINHCLTVLRQSLMCDANTDFSTYFWYEGFETPMGDFKIDRKCGDFDGVTSWARQHRTDQATVNSIQKPPEFQAVPLNSNLRRILYQIDGQ